MSLSRRDLLCRLGTGSVAIAAGGVATGAKAPPRARIGIIGCSITLTVPVVKADSSLAR